MKNLKKIVIIGMLVLPITLTGCKKENYKEEIEVVDEWIVAESDSDDESYTNKKEEISANNENEIDENKIDENKIDEIKDDNNKTDAVKDNESGEQDKNIDMNIVNKSEDSIILVENPVFTKSEITEDIKYRMIGKSMPEDANITFEELSYLTITYLDYNGKTKKGEMVVHEKLADEVLDIFREIYIAKFPIEKMSLIDDYNASDHASMVNNNSSAFCYRMISGTNKISNHGKGVAIDINPFYNPHVLKSSGKVNPPEASKYANRSLNEKGMIKYNDAVYKAFTSRGWKWGGTWNNPDYQHFEKSI